MKTYGSPKKKYGVKTPKTYGRQPEPSRKNPKVYGSRKHNPENETTSDDLRRARKIMEGLKEEARIVSEKHAKVDEATKLKIIPINTSSQEAPVKPPRRRNRFIRLKG